MDMNGIKNVLHGGFLIAGYQNFATTGNERYWRISVTLLAMMMMPTFLATSLATVNLYVTNNMAVIPQVFVSGMMFLLVVASWMAQQHAYATAVIHDPQHSLRHKLIGDGIQYLRTRLGHDTYERFIKLKAFTHRVLQLEVLCFVAVNVLVFIYRYPLAATADGHVPFTIWCQGFMGGYTMAIHLGWVLGNGFHGVATNSRKCLELYWFGKMIFGGLSVVEVVTMATRMFVVGTLPPRGSPASSYSSTTTEWLASLFPSCTASPGSTIPITCSDSGWALLPSVIVAAVYAITQITTFVLVNRVHGVLNTCDFNTEAYAPAGDLVAAKSEGFSIWSLYTSSPHDSFVRRRAFWAAIVALGQSFCFQLECVIIIWNVPRLETFVEAINFGLHATAIFGLCFFRAVQDYGSMLQRRKTLQMFAFGLYALVTMVQLGSLLAVLSHRGWANVMADTDTRLHWLFLLGYLSVRTIVNFAGSYAYYELRLKPKREMIDPRVRCYCLCFVWRRLDAEVARNNNDDDRNHDDEEVPTMELTALTTTESSSDVDRHSNSIKCDNSNSNDGEQKRSSISSSSAIASPISQLSTARLAELAAAMPRGTAAPKAPLSAASTATGATEAPAEVLELYHRLRAAADIGNGSTRTPVTALPVTLSAPTTTIKVVQALPSTSTAVRAIPVAASSALLDGVQPVQAILHHDDDDDDDDHVHGKDEQTLIGVGATSSSDDTTVTIHHRSNGHHAMTSGTSSSTSATTSANRALHHDHKQLVDGAEASDPVDTATLTDPDDRRRVGCARLALQSFFTMFVILGVLFTWHQGRLHDLIGLRGNGLTVADIGMGHHMGYAMAFHFCFILSGYGWRGVRAANIMFSQFTALAACSIWICIVTLLVATWSTSNDPVTSSPMADDMSDARSDSVTWMNHHHTMLLDIHISQSRAWQLLMCAMFITITFTIMQLRRWFRFLKRNLARFPQTGFAMT